VVVRSALAVVRGAYSIIDGKEFVVVGARADVLGALALVHGTLVGFVAYMAPNPTLVALRGALALVGGRRGSSGA
jgi:hypothetical protein